MDHPRTIVRPPSTPELSCCLSELDAPCRTALAKKTRVRQSDKIIDLCWKGSRRQHSLWQRHLPMMTVSVVGCRHHMDSHSVHTRWGSKSIFRTAPHTWWR